MDLFGTFKATLARTVGAIKGKDDPSVELLKAIEAADDWEALEQRLIALRAVSRKRQQEVLERLEPLAERIEGLIEKAKTTKVKVMKQNLLRQADGYMKELEAEDEPAQIHAANCTMLTNILKQVKRARAMADRGIEAEAIDAIGVHVESIVVNYESALEAAGELEDAGQVHTGADVDPAAIEQRLSTIYETAPPETEACGDGAPRVETPDPDIDGLEERLY